VCCIADSTLHGAPAHFATLLYSASPALMVSGGSVFVSGTTLRGGDGYHGVGGSAPGQSAVVAGGGALQIADCTLQAGSSPPSQPGAAALVGAANTLWARSALTGGTGSTSGGGTSGPVQHVPQLVGMRISGSFRLGFATTLAAVAGSSLPLGMVGGFDPAPTTRPIVLGPVFGASVDPMPLLVAYPSAGAVATHVVNVPNVGQLLGVAVCAQAFQLDGALVRASAAVAGVVH
jgi:hypothetical protein